MVTDNVGFRYAINVDSILWISPDTRNVCMVGMDGIMTIRPEGVQRLLDVMEVDHDAD